MAAVSRGRRTQEASRGPRVLPRLLGLATAITACLLAWGYLVYIAIDFGSEARRAGDSTAWGLLTLAAVGAVACLFLGFLLTTRLLQLVGLFPHHAPPRDRSAPKGGKRAKR